MTAEEAVAALALFRNAATRQHLTGSILQDVRGRVLQTRRMEEGGAGEDVRDEITD